MKRKYKGFELEAVREDEWSVMGMAVRQSDRWILYDGDDIAGTIRETLDYLQVMVDNFLINPKLYPDSADAC